MTRSSGAGWTGRGFGASLPSDKYVFFRDSTRNKNESVPTERGFAEDDQMFLDPEGLDLPGEIEAKDAVSIPQQVARDLVKREGLPRLLTGPFGGGMSGDMEMENPPTIVSEDQEP